MTRHLTEDERAAVGNTIVIGFIPRPDAPVVRVVEEVVEAHVRDALRQAADACCTCHMADAPHEDWCVATGILMTPDEDGEP